MRGNYQQIALSKVGYLVYKIKKIIIIFKKIKRKWKIQNKIKFIIFLSKKSKKIEKGEKFYENIN